MCDTFINKYKPQLIDDFNFTGNLSAIIKNLISINSLNVLIVGGSNSGKTTLLYAIIREYYQIPIGEPIQENNILFINNLKEQGIQYFRTEMKTFCQLYSSIPNKRRIIVVDDLDTINEQSQQVFRSYLDKYRNNIFFISVCLNVQKVIQSLQSRLHVLMMPMPSAVHCRNILDRIIRCENIKITEEAKTYLLGISQDSIRNVINHLEKMWILDIPIDLDVCQKLCFNIPYVVFEEYVEHLKKGEMLLAIHDLYKVNSSLGYSVIDILDEFFSFIKITHLLDEETKYKCITVVCEYIMHFHLIHEDAIELALFTNKLIECF